MNRISYTALDMVSVPENLQQVFRRAQNYVKHYFSVTQQNPEKGSIKFSGERYILVRASSMSKEFFEMMVLLYKDRGKEEARALSFNFLFDIAHAIGKADAKSFFTKMKVSDPIEKLSSGPVHFAYTGNVHDPAGGSTYCHDCGELLIGRDWYELSDWNLTSDGKCRTCGQPCPGRFDSAPGTWGARRQSIRLQHYST